MCSTKTKKTNLQAYVPECRDQRNQKTKNTKKTKKTRKTKTNKNKNLQNYVPDHSVLVFFFFLFFFVLVFLVFGLVPYVICKTFGFFGFGFNLRSFRYCLVTYLLYLRGKRIAYSNLLPLPLASTYYILTCHVYISILV